MALREEGIESIMVNCNPETVSTDYDTSDRLYFEPLTLEDVLEICHVEKPWGVIVQFGGQTPLKLAVAARRGRRADPRHQRRRDRSRRGSRAVRRGDDEARPARAALGHRAQRSTRRARSPHEIGFPVMVRPSYVLGGRAMERVYDARGLEDYFARVSSARRRQSGDGRERGGRLPAARRSVPRRRGRARRRRRRRSRPARSSSAA